MLDDLLELLPDILLEEPPHRLYVGDALEVIYDRSCEFFLR